MNLHLKKLIHSQIGTNPLWQKVFILVLLLSLSLLLYLQPAEQSYSDQTLLKPKPTQNQIQKLDTNKPNQVPINPQMDMIALSLIHQQKKIKETPKGSNKGDSITEWSYRIFGKDGAPWCAIYCSELTNNTDYYPKFKTARAIGFAINSSYTIKQVMTNQVVLQPNWFAIKSRVGGNHVDLILSFNQSTKEVIVRGGNVGDMVSTRKVKLSLTAKNGYQLFTPTYKLN